MVSYAGRLWLGAARCVALAGNRLPFAYSNLLGSDLLPEMDEGGFILDYIMPAGSSLSETNSVLDMSSRFCAPLPRSKSRPAAPACRWAWPP